MEDEVEPINEYEQQREARIARNKAKLAELEVHKLVADMKEAAAEEKKAAKEAKAAKYAPAPGTIRRSSRNAAAATRAKLKQAVGNYDDDGHASSDQDADSDSADDDETPARKKQRTQDAQYTPESSDDADDADIITDSNSDVAMTDEDEDDVNASAPKRRSKAVAGGGKGTARGRSGNNRHSRSVLAGGDAPAGPAAGDDEWELQQALQLSIADSHAQQQGPSSTAAAAAQPKPAPARRRSSEAAAPAKKQKGRRSAAASSSTAMGPATEADVLAVFQLLAGVSGHISRHQVLQQAGQLGVEVDEQLVDVMFEEAAGICGVDRVGSVTFEQFQKVFAAAFA